MKETLISIQKPHTDNIFSGIKKVEWRTFSLPAGRHHVYETKRGGGLGMVIGTFRTNTYYHFTDVSDIPEWLIRDGCVSREFLKQYARGRSLFANVIYDVKRFELPKLICEYNAYARHQNCQKCGYWNIIPYPCYTCPKCSIVTNPPQSFMYVDV